MKGKKVVVAGHVCLDITPVFADKAPREIHDVLVPGKLIQMDAADVHSGGAVANTGLAMKLLGADVKLVCKVGKDNFGQAVVAIFKEFGAHENMIVDESSSTSYSVVIAAPGVDRIFLHHSGANDSFESQDISHTVLEDVSLFHFGYPTIMKGMYSDGGRQTIDLFKKVHSKGIMTSLDMSAIDPNSPAGAENWRSILAEVMPYVDVFAPSAEELCYMLDRHRFNDWVTRSKGCDMTEILKIEEDIVPLGETLMAMGAKIVLIKCGAKGIYYRTAKAEVMTSMSKAVISEISEWSDKQGFEKSFKPDRILSATGAGDTTIGAFLCAMLEDHSLESCVELAAATGAMNVTAYDALGGLVSLKELWARINKGWEKVEEV